MENLNKYHQTILADMDVKNVELNKTQIIVEAIIQSL
jgi:hypothetical protein